MSEFRTAATRARPHAPRWVRALRGALVVAVAAYAAATQLPAAQSWPWLHLWVYNGLLATCAVLIGAAARRHGGAGWWFVCAAVAAWTVGDVAWSAIALTTGEEPPVPSVADLGYLAYYPLLWIGLVLVLRRSLGRLPVSVTLDGAIVGLCAMAVGSMLMPRLVDAATGDRLQVMTNLAYPQGDLLSAALAAAAVTVVGRRDRSFLLLAVGCALMAAADTSYLLAVAADTYVEGGPLDALWPAATLVVALAAWCRPVSADSSRLPGIVLPAVAAVAAVVLLAVDGTWYLPPAGRTVAAAALLLGVARTALTFRQVVALRDAERRAVAAAEHQAVTDELTGLTNRRGFHALLDRELARPGSGPADGAVRAALLLLDLDRFREINDGLGHGIGDELLRGLGPRLAAVLPPGSELARVGGDEFAVYLRGADEATAVATAAEVASAVAAPVDLEGLPLQVRAGIGIALVPDHADTGADLLKRADIALYAAKRDGGGPRVYAVRSADDARERLQTVTELRAALGTPAVTCHYQPKYDVRTGAVVGLEALVRWQHPERGLMPPGLFLAGAEDAGLMRPLTEAVLATALARAALLARGGRRLPVSVNLSATNLLDETLPAMIEGLLAEHGLGPDLLVLEITESVLMTDPERARDVIVRLRELGVGISVDDYGTGYSSLAYLRNLPVTELKLDRTFVRDVARSPRDQVIVRTTADLAHSLGLVMVAEGVETVDDWDSLAALGCDVAQGYHLSRPVPGEELDRVLAAPPPAVRSVLTRAG